MKTIQRLVGYVVVLLVALFATFACSDVYVLKTGNNTMPYDTWERACTDLDAALDYGRAITIGDGIWQLNRRHTVRGDIRSMNGPYSTSIDCSLITNTQNVYHILKLKGTIDGISFVNANLPNEQNYIIGSYEHSTVNNCIFYNNTIYLIIYCASARVNNCVFYKNRINRSGWALVATHDNSIIQNCLFLQNTIDNDYHSYSVDVKGGLIENIIVAQSGNDSVMLARNGSCNYKSIIKNSCVDGPIIINGDKSSTNLAEIANIITNDPQLIVTNPASALLKGNSISIPHFYLSSNSPCIDAGIYNTNLDNSTDLEGRERVVGASVDIGPNEYGAPVRFCANATKGTANASIIVTWIRLGTQYEIHRGSNAVYAQSSVIVATTNNWFIDNSITTTNYYYYWIKEVGGLSRTSRCDYGFGYPAMRAFIEYEQSSSSNMNTRSHENKRKKRWIALD